MIDRSYAGAVRRCFARLQFLRLVAIAAATTFIIQTYIIVSTHLPKGYQWSPTVGEIEIGSLVAFWLSIKLSGFYVKRMRSNWDHAMVSNLAKNIGGGYEQGTRDRISDIIVK